MIIAGTTNILVEQAGLFGLRPARALPIPSILQNRRHRAVGARAEAQRPRAGGIEAFGIVLPGKPKDTDAGAEALFGMRARAQDQIDQGGGIIADRRGFALDAFMGPIAVAPMRTRHVLGQRRWPMWAVAALMGGDQFAAMEHLHRPGGDPHFDLLAQQAIRHGIRMMLTIKIRGRLTAILGRLPVWGSGQAFVAQLVANHLPRVHKRVRIAQALPALRLS